VKISKNQIIAHFISGISGIVIAGVASSLIGSASYLTPLAFILGTQHRSFVNVILKRLK